MARRGLWWIAAVGWTAVASAAPTTADKLAAEAVFDTARKLMSEGKIAEACPKFAESQRLDPGVGVLLYLADCYERSGKLASAWLTWREAAAAGRAAGQLDREKLALGRASALEPRLPKVQVEVPTASAVAGLVVTRDGGEISAGLWGVPVPVDPGDHVIEAKAPGRKAWSKTVTVGAQAALLNVQVPPLEVESAPAVTPSASAAPVASSAPPPPVASAPPAATGAASLSGRPDSEAPPAAARSLVLGARLGGLLPVGQTGATAAGKSSAVSSLYGAGAALEVDAGLRLNQHLTGYAWLGYGLLSSGSQVGQGGSQGKGADRLAVGVGAQVATRHEAQGGVGVYGEAGVLLYNRYQIRDETAGAAGLCSSTTTLAGSAVRLGGGVHVPIGGGVLLTPFVAAEVGRFVQASYEGSGACGLRGGDYGINQREMHASLLGGAAFSYGFGL